MTVVSPQAKQPNSRKCISVARQGRCLKADDELYSLIICLVAFKSLQGAKKTDPVVREQLSWRIHASTLVKEKAFNRYYRMSFSTFQELLFIVGPYLVVDYYQTLRRSRGIPPHSPATMLQCALSWLAGGSYHHIRVITGVSTATFTVSCIVLCSRSTIPTN
ncbi:hypothetical protein PHMEG_00019891 [Phytophthora megakarya]|uniref:Uncharacterized protein n=1 Tax=Phytophthora megakarya TaxID=4795 RepID=A0A225VRQ9_9STRA|nr:hypothetical protein PHMEG_00019891 [Phytophthora megakarya]